MKNKIFLIFIFLTLNFVFAEMVPYFSFKKVSGGLMIGVEAINQKTNLSLKPTGYRYEWLFPEISLEPKKTNLNLFFLSLEKPFKSLSINLRITRPLTKENYELEGKIVLEAPQVKILRRHKGTILPVTSLKKEDFLVLDLKNFTSKNLQYIWEFNGVFIGNEKEIPVSLIKEKSGIIKAKVYGDLLKESAEDLKFIKIED